MFPQLTPGIILHNAVTCTENILETSHYITTETASTRRRWVFFSNLMNGVESEAVRTISSLGVVLKPDSASLWTGSTRPAADQAVLGQPLTRKYPARVGGGSCAMLPYWTLYLLTICLTTTTWPFQKSGYPPHQNLLIYFFFFFSFQAWPPWRPTPMTWSFDTGRIQA